MSTEPLISQDWHFAIWSIMFGLAALAFWTDTTKLGRNVSGVAITLAASMVLSNLNIIPQSAPAYDLVWSYLVPLAVPLLLFKADMRRVIPETKGMFIAFILGTIGTLVGSLLGFWLLPLGEQAHNLAGVFSATYIGGSMNMVAVAKAVEIDSSLISASVAADNVIGVIYLALLAMMPAIGLLRRWLPSPIIEKSEQQAEGVIAHTAKSVNFNLLHISFALTLGLFICAISYAIAEKVGLGHFSILFITAITVVIANLFPKQLAKLEGDYDIGLLLMYLFFVVVGASADIAKMIDSALIIVLFAGIIVTCHMLVIFIGSRIFKLDLAEVIIASNACVLGPPTAAALAAGKRWNDLVTPAIMLGIFGYVIANFFGVTLAALLS